MISNFKPWLGVKVENFELQTRPGFPGHYSIHLSLLVLLQSLSLTLVWKNFQGLCWKLRKAIAKWMMASKFHFMVKSQCNGGNFLAENIS